MIIADHMGAAEGTSTMPPNGTHCCRYCDVLHSLLDDYSYKFMKDPPHLRDPDSYEAIIKEARALIAAKKKTAAKALLQENGYREAVVSFII